MDELNINSVDVDHIESNTVVGKRLRKWFVVAYRRLETIGFDTIDEKFHENTQKEYNTHIYLTKTISRSRNSSSVDMSAYDRFVELIKRYNTGDKNFSDEEVSILSWFLYHNNNITQAKLIIIEYVLRLKARQIDENEIVTIVKSNLKKLEYHNVNKWIEFFKMHRIDNTKKNHYDIRFLYEQIAHRMWMK